MSTSHFSIKEHILPGSYIREYPNALANDQEDTLDIHIKQYTPLDGSNKTPGAVTIIGTHANGFAKELYEALWDDLFQTLKQKGKAIAGIWTVDMANEGTSGVLNEYKLGNDPSWFDTPRDLFLMINHFRKEMPRPLVGFGHSMGATHLVNVALMHPRLFSTMIFMDPILHHTLAAEPNDDPSTESATRLSTFRRDKWPSREHAKAYLLKSPFYQAWDPRVFDQWIKHGLRDLPTAIYPLDQNKSTTSTSSQRNEVPVTLTTTKHQEVWTYLRPRPKGPIDKKLLPDFEPAVKGDFPFYRPESPKTFRNLPYLRPSVLYLFGDKSNISKPGWREAKVDNTGIGLGGSGGVKEGRVKRIDLDGDHFFPMQMPGKCAEVAGDWITVEIELWRRDEEEWKKNWVPRDVMEKRVVSEEWKRNLGGDPRGKMAKL